MDSIFRHRTPAPAVESFTDFWNLIYARMAPPAEGWPAPIRHCLGAVGILPTEKESVQEVVQPSSPRTPVSSSFSTPPTAIVRREALSRVQSPQRPQKVFGAFPIMPSTPPSPVNTRRASGGASSVRRTPLSAIQLCDTPSKRRRLMCADADADDKENALCAGKIPSVAERVAGLNVAGGGRKRRYEEVEEASEGDVELPMPKTLRGKMKPRSKPVAKIPVAKKPRLASPAPSAASIGSNESEDERTVEAELTAAVRFPSVQAEGEDSFFSERRADAPQRTRGKGLRAIVASEAAQQAVPK
jgi:hypothetical protein